MILKKTRCSAELGYRQRADLAANKVNCSGEGIYIYRYIHEYIYVFLSKIITRYPAKTKLISTRGSTIERLGINLPPKMVIPQWKRRVPE